MPSSDAPVSIDSVTLTVHDLERVADFYRDVLGLAVHARDGGTATLGAGRPLLHLRRDAAARRHAPGDAGLFHTAFLLPSRADLGAFLRRHADRGQTLDGAADHGVSEALYLADPEGNGIEVYWDKPREAWPIAGGRIEMGNDPIDLGDLAAAATAPFAGAPADTVIGHVHLKVGDLAAAEAFFTGPLGLALTHRYPAASFFAAGSYHHHVAANVWRSRGAPPVDGRSTGIAEIAFRATPSAFAGLAHGAAGSDGETIVLAEPSGIPLRVVAGAPETATA
jgi:catechol 2,3-dioxygenase